MASVQTQKSALQGRINLGQSTRLFSHARNLGEGLMCPAGSGDIANDVYGRPVDQTTLLLNDSACSHYTKFSVAARLDAENLERPYLPVCAAGLRMVGDLAGLGRDVIQQNLYGEGYRGNFIRNYNTPNNMPWEEGPKGPSRPYYHKLERPYDFSHDSSNQPIRG